MKSQYYHDLLLNEYKNQELSKEDLSSTLIHYAELFSKEKEQKTSTTPMNNKNTIKTMNNKEIKIDKEPKIVGGYEITGSKERQILFSFAKKPNLINRLFCKWCLGWTWKDE